MDTWEEITARVKNGILAEEPEAALAAGLELFANFGRVLEQMGADIDRIATTLEKSILVDRAPDGGAEFSDALGEPPVHDL